MVFRFAKVQGADASMGNKLALERAAILTYSLRCYRELFEHIKTTPKQDWCYEYFIDGEVDAEARKFPLLQMLRQRQFSHLNATYTIEYAASSTTTVPELQRTFDLYMESKRNRSQKLTELALTHVLRMASQNLANDETFTYIRKQDYYKCEECGADVDTQTPTSSACRPDCSNQCPPGCYRGPLRASYLHKIKKSSRIINPKIVKNLRITTDAGSMVPGAEATSLGSHGRRA